MLVTSNQIKNKLVPRLKKTLGSGAASLGTVLSAIDSLPSIEGGNILYASDTNTFQPVELSPFAINFLQCNSPQQLRNYWAGIRDVDFDDCGISWSAFGSPFMSSKNAKFHKALQLNGSSYLKMNSPITLGGSPFSIDFWAFYYPSSSVPAAIPVSLFASSSERIQIFTQPSGKAGTMTRSVSDGNPSDSFSSDLVSNSLSHFELDFDGQSFFFFINGSLQFSFDWALSPHSYSLFLGANDSSNFFSGAISEFRLSSVCRHSSSFTPPSSPYLPDSDTLSLLHFNG